MPLWRQTSATRCDTQIIRSQNFRYRSGERSGKSSRREAIRTGIRSPIEASPAAVKEWASLACHTSGAGVSPATMPRPSCRSLRRMVHIAAKFRPEPANGVTAYPSAAMRRANAPPRRAKITGQ